MNFQPPPAPRDSGPRSAPPLVAIVAGPDGREALQALLQAVPPGSGLAFVLMGPADAELLRTAEAADALRVRPLREPVRVDADTVYLAPPAPLAFEVDGRVHPQAPGAEVGSALAANLSLRAMAQAWGPLAAAVLLGRSSCEGIHAIRCIRDHGGLTVAADAQLSCAPSQRVDWVLPPAEVPNGLLRFFRTQAPAQTPAGPGSPLSMAGGLAPDDEDTLDEVLALLRKRTHCDFSRYRREIVFRRIARRMQVNQVLRLRDYLDCLRTRPGECGVLCEDLLVTAAPFFHEPAGLGALSARLSGLLAGKAPHEPLRVWVAGCAFGEEAYSVAMLLSEHARRLDPAPLVQVFATDLSEDALRVAREALYPPGIEADLAPARLRRFFTREDHGWRVRRELREMVLFARHDALLDPPFSRLDLVCCRHLLAGLDPAARTHLLETFHFALQPGGLLLPGGLESVGEAAPLFDALDATQGLYCRRAVAAWPRSPAMAHRRGDARQRAAAPSSSDRPLAVPDGPVGMSAAGAGLHLRLLEQLAPPSLLVDHAHEILHLSPGAGRFLRTAGGEPGRQLLALALPSLRIGLRSALLQAQQSGQPAGFAATATDESGRPQPLEVRVVPFSEDGDDFFLVLFQPAAGSPAATAAPEADGPVARALDRELDRLQHQLRDTVEQYEASNEELKASNEALLAMNEELQVAAEELDASREELESTNTELLAVNRELQDKLAALQQAHSDLDNLMAATGMPTVFLDRALRITRYTPAAVRVFKLIPRDVGRPLLDLATPLRYPQLEADAHRVLQRLIPLEREVAHEDGSCLLARLVPYRSDHDRIAGLVLCFVDISERKRAQLALERHDAELAAALASAEEAKAALEAADAAKDRFLAMLSHELRNPLSSISNAAEVLSKSTLPGSVRTDAAAVVRRQTAAMRRLLDELLDITRMRLGQLSLHPEPVVLQRIVAEALETVQPHLEAHRHALQLALPAEDVRLHADPLRLRQLVTNLLDNACKYTPDGGRISLAIEPDPPGQGVALAVGDDGIGMEAAETERLFELFAQSEDGRGHRRGGVGIGLSLSRSIAQLHGGTLTASSRGRGLGSEFRVWLPLGKG